MLEEVGIVDHVHLAHGPALFHLAKDEHHHLVCDRCGRVAEVGAADVRPLAAMLRRQFGFELAHRNFAIVGICASCSTSTGKGTAEKAVLAPA